MSKRQLTPQEKNFLFRHRYDLNNQDIPEDIPVEYLVGKAEFRGLELQVNQHTLIPRIESEQLVELALENILKNFNKNQKINIADVCTGSGCLGISLALELTKKNYNFHLYLSDISKEALEIAQKNYLTFLPHHLDQSTFLISDLFNNYPAKNFIDLVISNPPYIPSNRIKTLDNSVKNHEPHLALDGGSDGLTVIKKIVNQLPRIQNNKVNALIEIDETHNSSDLKISENIKLSLIKDDYGKNRFLSLFSL